MGPVEEETKRLILSGFENGPHAATTWEGAIDPARHWNTTTPADQARHALWLSTGNAKALEYLAKKLDESSG
jgi:hypothetical protein